MSPFQVMLLPGIVLPGELAYGGLVTALGQDVETIVKALDDYREDAPPPDYSLETEVAGILREAGARGWSRFHLVGYSGGAAAALAFVARHPARLLSLALLEPAWAGNWDWSPEHRRLWANYEELEQLPHEQLMPAFMRLQVRPSRSLPRDTTSTRRTVSSQSGLPGRSARSGHAAARPHRPSESVESCSYFVRTRQPTFSIPSHEGSGAGQCRPKRNRYPKIRRGMPAWTIVTPINPM